MHHIREDWTVDMGRDKDRNRLPGRTVDAHLYFDLRRHADQAASLEPNGIHRLVRDIRLVETALGDGVKRVLERELPVMEKLRRVGGGWRDRYF